MTAPKAAIDAKVSVLEDLAALLARKVEAHTGADPDSMPHLVFSTDVVLAALLDGGTVREQWGCRLTVPDGEIPDCWRESREAAEAMVAWHINNRSIATPALIRRLHLTLAAEVMEGEQR